MEDIRTTASTFTDEEILTCLHDTWKRLIARRVELIAIEPRVDDVLWPLQQFEAISLEEFERPTMCLLARPERRTMALGLPIVRDMARVLCPQNAVIGITWFWLHQLVHISQGLNYRTFRSLNQAGDRQETMRADCHADFISLKTTALFLALEEASPDMDIDRRADLVPMYHKHLMFLCDVLLPSMIEMSPNSFIPSEREIEKKRIIALMILRRYVSSWSQDSGDLLIDASIFPQWSEARDELYVWMNQVNLLNREPLPVDPKVITSIIDLIGSHLPSKAYEQLCQISWPRLTRS